MKAGLLMATLMALASPVWAQNAGTVKASTLNVAIDNTVQRLPEGCGGEDLALSGKILLNSSVSFNGSGGVDVKIVSDRRSLTGTSPTQVLKGSDSGSHLYSNSSAEDFEWIQIESIPIQSPDGAKRAMVHLQWHYRVTAGGDFTAQVQSLNCDCGA